MRKSFLFVGASLVIIAACAAQQNASTTKSCLPNPDGSAGECAAPGAVAQTIKLIKQLPRQVLGQHPVCYEGTVQSAVAILQHKTVPFFPTYINAQIDQSGIIEPEVGEDGEIYTVYLTNADINAMYEIDDEFDLNFDHYKYADYVSRNIGQALVIKQCN